jgi:hypothetical protein
MQIIREFVEAETERGADALDRRPNLPLRRLPRAPPNAPSSSPSSIGSRGTLRSFQV